MNIIQHTTKMAHSDIHSSRSIQTSPLSITKALRQSRKNLLECRPPSSIITMEKKRTTHTGQHSTRDQLSLLRWDYLIKSRNTWCQTTSKRGISRTMQRTFLISLTSVICTSEHLCKSLESFGTRAREHSINALQHAPRPASGRQSLTFQVRALLNTLCLHKHRVCCTLMELHCKVMWQLTEFAQYQM